MLTIYAFFMSFFLLFLARELQLLCQRINRERNMKMLLIIISFIFSIQSFGRENSAKNSLISQAVIKLRTPSSNKRNQKNIDCVECQGIRDLGYHLDSNHDNGSFILNIDNYLGDLEITYKDGSVEKIPLLIRMKSLGFTAHISLYSGYGSSVIHLGNVNNKTVSDIIDSEYAGTNIGASLTVLGGRAKGMFNKNKVSLLDLNYGAGAIGVDLSIGTVSLTRIEDIKDNKDSIF